MWWVNKFGNISGPYSEEQIRKLVQTNRLTRLCKISEDRSSWMRIDESDFWKRAASQPETVELPEAAAVPLQMNVHRERQETPIAVVVPSAHAQDDIDAEFQGVDDGVAIDDAEVEYSVATNPTAVQKRRVRVQPTRAIRAVPVAAPVAPVESKSRLVYILLALLVGGLGIHNFYAGRTNAGLCQLLITLFLGWLVIPAIAVFVWLIVDICTVTTDGSGMKMT